MLDLSPTPSVAGIQSLGETHFELGPPTLPSPPHLVEQSHDISHDRSALPSLVMVQDVERVVEGVIAQFVGDSSSGSSDTEEEQEEGEEEEDGERLEEGEVKEEEGEEGEIFEPEEGALLTYVRNIVTAKCV